MIVCVCSVESVNVNSSLFSKLPLWGLTQNKRTIKVVVCVWGGSVVWGRGGEVAPSDFYCYSSFYSSQMATQSPVHHTEPPLFSLSLSYSRFPSSSLPFSASSPSFVILSPWCLYFFPLSLLVFPLFPSFFSFSTPSVSSTNFLLTTHPFLLSVNQLLHSLLHFASSVSRIKKLIGIISDYLHFCKLQTFCRGWKFKIFFLLLSFSFSVSFSLSYWQLIGHICASLVQLNADS